MASVLLKDTKIGIQDVVSVNLVPLTTNRGLSTQTRWCISADNQL